MDIASLDSSGRFRKFYRLLCETIGIKLALVELEGKGFANLDHLQENAPLCSFLQRDSRFAVRCRACDKRNKAFAKALGHGRLYRCHAGLYDLIVPLSLGGEMNYAFIGGQILAEPPSEQGFKALLRDLESFPFDKKLLREAYFSMPSLPLERLRKMLELIEFFASHFQELGPRLLEEEPSEPTLFTKANHFLELHFREPISLKSTADSLGISAVWLCELFKRNGKEGFAVRLRRFRTAEAAKLLRDSSWKLERIAKHSGFANLRSFDRNFKLDYGRTPREYRASRHGVKP